MSVDELVSELRQKIQENRYVVTDLSRLPEEEARFVQQLLPVDSLVLQEATLEADVQAVTITGYAALFQLERVEVKVSYTPVNGQNALRLSFRAAHAPGEAIPAAPWLEETLAKTDLAGPYFCSELELLAFKEQRLYSWQVRLASSRSLSAGADSLQLTDILVTLPYAQNAGAPAQLLISATAHAGELAFPLNAVLGDQTPEWSGALAALPLQSFIDSMCGPACYPIGAPDIHLSDSLLFLRKQEDGNYSLTLHHSSEMNGTYEIIIAPRLGNWHFTSGFLLPPNWDLTRFSCDLGPFSQLPLVGSTMYIASLDDSSFTLPRLAANHPAAHAGAKQGTWMYTGVLLNGHLMLKSLNILLNTQKLDAVARIKSDSTVVEWTASLQEKESYAIADSLEMTAFEVSGSSNRVDMTIHMEVAANVYGEKLVFAVETEFSLDPKDYLLPLQHTWKNPFGFSELNLAETKLRLELHPELRLTIESELPLSAGIAADSDLDQQSLQLACPVIGQELRDYFYGEYVGSLTLLQLVQTLNLEVAPAYLQEMTWSNSRLYLIGNPQGTSIEAASYNGRGLIITGTLDVIGIRSDARLFLDSQGQLKLEAEWPSFELGETLYVTGTEERPGPLLAITRETNGQWSGQIAGRITFFSESKDVLIQLSEYGIKTSFDGKLFHEFGADLQVHAPWGQAASGEFTVKGRLGPDFLNYVQRMIPELLNEKIESIGAQHKMADAAVDEQAQWIQSIEETIRRQENQHPSLSDDATATADRPFESPNSSSLDQLRASLEQAQTALEEGKQAAHSLKMEQGLLSALSLALPGLALFGQTVVTIREVGFEAGLQQLQHHTITLYADVEFIGQRFRPQFEFDFYDLAASVDNLLNELIVHFNK
ncbi:hypothetical protein ACFPVX_19720 [Cohnella faecalis]|uniref:Uncharacterized protein n=1 Tax=Cohnella faecalis TaxID=2315694 RepID=A0A398CP31_9BACL|nr:hypothetical protein [Cohnella faecalis]RIE04323.1 hypothetical protein D3H35_06890 [Cohnella faecalis]